ncbi:DUF4293 domain-containing protein [Breznakibacter xylanolyticus]|nr:DUF4293 domain-containing protein [Breznakibacter xylanolyticus]MBN2743803.1 DUF4293 domain-containing protein [Marinilabiliaceae bacterium]
MIQRKQTIYLFISAILTGVLLMSRYADFASPTGNFYLDFRGIWQHTGETSTLEIGAYPLMILVSLSTLMSLVTIFLFKNRPLQIRLCGMNAVLMAGITGFIFYYGHTAAKALEAVVSYGWTVVFPIIGIVMTILALIAIGKDEALIRTMNRIR